MKRSQTDDPLISNCDFKQQVAREAAALLYFRVEKEYRQAKQRAAKILGAHFLPSNVEVAIELDKIAEEKEEHNRKERLIEMRQEALEVMQLLKSFCPVLEGSVWRGTIKKGSDIDITVYTDNPEKILASLKSDKLTVLRNVWKSVNKHGNTISSFHIYAQNRTKHILEIVVRPREEVGKRRKCETFGDIVKGLKIKELEHLLKENPTARFIPDSS